MLPMLLATIENDVDRAQFAEIYEQYHERMEQAALRILKDTHDAEDAVQNAVIGEQHTQCTVARCQCQHPDSFGESWLENIRQTAL